MKKLILIVSAFCFAIVTLKAQNTSIVRADFAYPNGSFKMKADTAFTLPANFEVGGLNKTWDFTTLKANETFTTKYLAPDADNGGDQVDGCNMVLQDRDDDESYIYLSVTDTAVIMLSSSDADSMSMGLDYMKMLPFPAEFGTSWEIHRETIVTYPGSDLGIQADSVRMTILLDYINSVDGEGILKLPVGDREAIRVKTTGAYTLITEIYIMGAWMDVGDQSSEYISYQFYGKGGGHNLVIIETDPDKQDAHVSYRSDNLMSNRETGTELKNVTVYPNPSTNGELNIVADGSYRVSILDAKGQLMKEVSFAENESRRTDISDLPKGVYFLRVVHTDGSVHTHKIVRQ